MAEGNSMRSLVSLVVALVLLAVCAGCGGSEAPTSVAADDLSQTGDFWNSLTPDLKVELVEFGKDRLGGERPDGASVIAAVSNDDLVDQIDTQYTNEAKQSTSIYDTYVGANDQLAGESLDALIPGLEAGK